MAALNPAPPPPTRRTSCDDMSIVLAPGAETRLLPNSHGQERLASSIRAIGDKRKDRYNLSMLKGSGELTRPLTRFNTGERKRMTTKTRGRLPLGKENFKLIRPRSAS